MKSIPGVGNHLFKRLLERFGTPENVLTASNDALVEIQGISRRLAGTISGYQTPDAIREELDHVFRKGYKIVTMADSDYPPLLLEIPDPPPYIYVYGELPDTINNIAIVGSRSPSRNGITTAIRLAKELVSKDVTVVSGMARGIDTAAHFGALQAEGKTVAVLGSGLEKIYPHENKKLFHDIALNGAVITEYSLNTRPEAFNFPARNRIISGMSLGTVVVEAAKKSGALITARLALEQNREVFAVPGDIHSLKAAGSNRLLKSGAKWVENADDILEEVLLENPDVSVSTGLPSERKSSQKEPLRLEPEEDIVYRAIGNENVHIDDLVRKTAFNAGRVASILLQLELKGVVMQSPGNYFSII